jgi:hypothetical protein
LETPQLGSVITIAIVLSFTMAISIAIVVVHCHLG